MPLPAGTLLMSTSTATLEPAFQYDLGRQWASVSLIQFQAPGCFGVDSTFMCRSNVALSVTGMSNVTMTGIPTPTVSLASGATDG